MTRLTDILLLVLIVAVVGLGVVVWRADVHARDDAERELCVARANATANIAMLAPEGAVEAEGRISALKTLGEQLDAC